ncbi:MAG: N-acetylneuraminate synthase family protein [Spirochaetales bacterium]|nr:N-acetylneuraminate synthase family protein [Spirochaetales bacterium]
MSINIGERTVGNRSPCLIIAEAGTSHHGDLDAAYSLIDAARTSGADCVKFQLVYADEICHPRTGAVELPGGKVDLYASFKALERDEGFYLLLKERAEASGLLFLCTAFGLRSARILKGIGVKAVKIASPELNHFPLLEETASYNIPLILSTGVSRLGDIETALSVTGADTAILHCITAYPAPEDEYNLRLLPPLSDLFGVPVGVSDHSADPVLVPALSAAVGARIIEKHITLSNEGGGLDDPIALPPSAFALMAAEVRRAEEAGYEETVLSMKKRYGEGRVEKVLGDGVKRLAASEQNNYRTTRRSIHALTDIDRGGLFTQHNTAILRTEKNLRPGIGPEYLSLICGKSAKRPVPEGEGITWEDVI